MQDILKRVRRLELKAKLAMDSQTSGAYHSKFKGQGMQFADLREYYYGDDIRHIDWKVTARTSSPHIKKFEEDRDLTVLILLDLSASQRFGSGGISKIDRSKEVAGFLAMSCSLNQDRVGLIAYTDEVEFLHLPKKGRNPAMRLLSKTLGYEPKGRGTNLSKALTAAEQVMAHRGVIIVISDFLDGGSILEGESKISNQMKRLMSRHRVIAVKISDVSEIRRAPVGLVDVEDAETGQIFQLDISNYSEAKRAQNFASNLFLEWDKNFKRFGLEVINIDSKEDYAKPIQAFFARSKRL